ncbi:glycosyltransferase involved in cell wall biosynthesis [Thiobaca trueperi]|uniref:Glycosyltransferase involved in cell wall biosynthesis n=2 Tax=Thiobaca trueperi TaxID=127458 RepID=A0A4R3N450_9GAMM|nr:glycosyltransferase involved in cell wall biosynthesis [Thiobaca trueperi]
MTHSCCFTVFTPTYNRAHTLNRAYESLKNQTFRDFEWLIIDDGSTDETQKLVASWSKEADFGIHYIFQENQGKHIAFNRGVQLARGRFFLALDSDDAAMPNALEIFAQAWDKIQSNQRGRFSAITGLCIDEQGKLIGDPYPCSPLDSDSSEIRYKYHIKGEKWGFQRTEVLKKFPFPEVYGIKFFPEGVIWSAISREYKTRFINEVVRVYYREETPGSQLTRSDPACHALSCALGHQMTINHDLRWLYRAPLEFIRSGTHYARFSFHVGDGFLAQAKKLSWPGRCLWIITVLPGFFVFLQDCINRQKKAA